MRSGREAQKVMMESERIRACAEIWEVGDDGLGVRKSREKSVLREGWLEKRW